MAILRFSQAGFVSLPTEVPLSHIHSLTHASMLIYRAFYAVVLKVHANIMVVVWEYILEHRSSWNGPNSLIPLSKVQNFPILILECFAIHPTHDEIPFVVNKIKTKQNTTETLVSLHALQLCCEYKEPENENPFIPLLKLIWSDQSWSPATQKLWLQNNNGINNNNNVSNELTSYEFIHSK